MQYVQHSLLLVLLGSLGQKFESSYSNCHKNSEFYGSNFYLLFLQNGFFMVLMLALPNHLFEVGDGRLM